MQENSSGFEELTLWKKVREFKKEVSLMARNLPAEEKFRLTDQLIRSSRSINALITERHGRFTYPDQIHFCIQARGSLTETVNHLMDAYDKGNIREEILNDLKSKAKEIERMLNGYFNFLRKKKHDPIKKNNPAT